MSDVMQIALLQAQVARLEAANAALAAALGAIQKRAGDCRRGETAVLSDSYHLLEIEREAGAALSDTGKGWLPPEVREQAAQAIRLAIAKALPRDEESAAYVQELWAALDALEVK